MKKLILIISFVFLTGIASVFTQTKPDSTSLKKDSSGVQYNIQKVFNQYVPEIKKVLKEKVGPVTKDILRNDDAMSFTFRGVYEFLPTPLKWIVKKETFVGCCMTNRFVLIDQLPDKPNNQKISK